MKHNYFKKHLFLFVFLLFLSVKGTLLAQTVFINEIHYDNDGTDSGEAIEIVGPAGTDLTGWNLVLYNGNGGAVYDTAALSGVISDQSNGYGTVYVSISGIQNGSPDGLALVDNSGTIIQFLSYEGTITAADGAAVGMTSVDIGISETSSTPVGYSLQLAGTGLVYADFTWQAASANTFGGINNGQIFSGTVVVDNEAPSTPTNLTASNTTQISTDLVWTSSTDNIGVTGYQIFEGTTQIATTTESNYTVTDLTANTTYAFTVKAIDAAENSSESSNEVSITTLEYTVEPITTTSVFINEIHYDNESSDSGEAVEVVGPAGTDLTGWSIVPYNGNGGTSYSITSLTGVLSDQMNGYGTIYVSISGLQNGAPDGLALVDSEGTVIQFLSYEGTFTATNGPAEGMESTDIGISEASSTPVGSSLQLVGAGTVYTDFTWELLENTFGDINTGQKFGDLVFINEIHYDNASTDVGEAVEIAGWAGTDLTGWSIVPYNGNGGTSYSITSLTGVLSDQMNGYGTIYVSISGLQNGAPDGLALVDSEGTVIQFLSYEGTFTATNGPAEGMESTDIGISEASSTPVGSSLQLVGTGMVYTDFAWELLENTFGSINTGQVFGDIEIPIDPITILEARNTADGTEVKVTGVLTVSDQFAGSAYIQDETGAIAVFDASVHGEGLFNIGDVVTITGVRSSYNDQLQISPVTSVEVDTESTLVIEPLTITLSEMVSHPAELVRIENPSFPKPSDMLFGNSNYMLTDASGSGELRIDNDASEIVGLAQPENCEEIIGVVGRYYEIFQLLPRMKTDLPCAEPYEQTGDDLAISKDKTFDVVTWNMEWFGDEANSPAAGNPDSDAIQKESVKNVLQNLDADIYAVEEISDDALFAEMVDEMDGYSYVLSEATSYPNDTEGTKQKVGFIYKSAVFSDVETKVLLESIHPYYNGGDDSALQDYPDGDATRFFASGRLPFMLTANVTIDGNTQQVNIIDLHARANTGDNQLKYDMRKYDVEVLKDSLDVYYPEANIIMLGDYNDDIDETVANITTTTDSSFKAYVDDVEHYNFLTSILSEEDYRSYVSYENMIDHIMVSNELSPNYIEESARVHYEFYSSDYTRTTSDHFPVSARLQLKLLTLDALNVTDVTCNGTMDGEATVIVSGGISPYTYTWSDGIETSTNTISGLSGGTYSVTITDALDNSVSQEFTVFEAEPLEMTFEGDTTVYYGYEDASCTTLSVTGVTGGVAPYTYEWSTGEITDVIEVCPTETTDYTVTVTDAKGCTVTTQTTVDVVDVTCGNNPRHPKVEICHKGRSLCVSEFAVKWHLEHGDTLGACDSEEEYTFITNLNVHPNPFVNYVEISFNSNVDTTVDLYIYNFYGKLVEQVSKEALKGKSRVRLNLGHLRSGFYYLKTIVKGEVKNVKILVKR